MASVRVKSNIFLGGPISYAIRGTTFKEEYKMVISKVHKILSDKHKVLSAHISENFGEKAPNIKKMFKIDIQWIRKAKSAVFILFYNKKGDSLLRTDGSYIEIGICYERNIPITIISDASIRKFPKMLQSMIRNSNKVKFIPLSKFLTQPKTKER
jgi:hypothetical protein